MAEPEIADLVSALAVRERPDGRAPSWCACSPARAGASGCSDLHALSRLASWLRDRDIAQQPLDDEVRERMRASVAEGEGGSIVDALDFLATAPRRPHRARGLQRDRARAAARAGRDVRAAALARRPRPARLRHPRRAGAAARHRGRRQRDRPLGGAHDGGVLRRAQRLPRGRRRRRASAGSSAGCARRRGATDLAPRPEDPEPGTVQLLTIHGAKGLEWDLVVVPRLVDDELPGTPSEGTNGWLAFGALPVRVPRRRRRAARVRLASRATTRKELLDAADAVQGRGAASATSRGAPARLRRRHPGAALAAAERLVLGDPDQAARPEPVPASSSPRPGVHRRAARRRASTRRTRWATRSNVVHLADATRSAAAGQAVEAAAELVRAAARTRQCGRSRALGARPRAAARGAPAPARRRASVVAVPTRVPASRFKDYVTDPASVAASLRRPMPERPYRATGSARCSTPGWRSATASAGRPRRSTRSPPNSTMLDDDADRAGGARARCSATFERSRVGRR